MKPVNLNYLLIKQSINEHLLRFLMRSQRIKQKVKMLVSFYIKNQAKNLKKSSSTIKETHCHQPSKKVRKINFLYI